MNEIRRILDEPEVIARIRSIVEERALPEFVVGFDVELGEFDGDPALWIIFQTDAESPENQAARWERAATRNRLVHDLHGPLLDGADGRYPYYRFLPREVAAPTP